LVDRVFIARLVVIERSEPAIHAPIVRAQRDGFFISRFGQNGISQLHISIGLAAETVFIARIDPYSPLEFLHCKIVLAG